MFEAAGLLASEVGILIRNLIQPRRANGRNPKRSAELPKPAAGTPVLLIPGLMADDASMRPLRAELRLRGHRAYKWKLGRNRGADMPTMQSLSRRIRKIFRRTGEPVVLVGWSLGGLMARELAKRDPRHIAGVITLGSPFSGNPDLLPVARYYRWVTRRVADADTLAALRMKPPVPTLAIWSARDVIVPQHTAMGEAAEVDASVEARCLHMQYPADPEIALLVNRAVRAILSGELAAEGERPSDGPPLR
ncbi:alpha/beta fold hydrolase [Pacificimonas flava]|nr:alpha/beta hydrolase [Pacificimonas flava]MBB5279640.1 pimeloyl-ACP methyl ester carboxylesterase [Pacificimonas flava]